MERDEIEIVKSTFSKIEYIDTKDEVSLRCIFFTPRNPVTKQKLIFIPGWTSTIYSWRYFLPYISDKIEIIYIETREKTSSKVSKYSQYGIMDISNDIAIVINKLGLQNGQYCIAGSSLGATSIIEAYGQLNNKPSSISLIVPNKEFKIPKMVVGLQVLPAPLLPYLKKFIQWFILTFKINPADKDHKASFIRALNRADAIKLRKSALAFRRFSMMDSTIGNISVPVMVIGASKDNLHIQAKIKQIAEDFPDGYYIDLITFIKSHSSEAAKQIIEFILSKEKYD